ncbi:Kae1-associated serine/threonine protein kinase [archaeon]|jgi:TP53 regulating kinase and related kinases|nr:Kae1-associated serine/threonine protein kinase [archaeon]
MIVSNVVQQGAEAVISLVDGKIVKERVEKGYRLKELDNKLRLRRTRGEAKILGKLSKVIDVPLVVEVDKFEIKMEFIDGMKLSEELENLDWREVCKKIGFLVGRMHDVGIVHGDLTTSNMIWKDGSEGENGLSGGKVYFIDFGLGFHSDKIEDKAVDLHLLKQALGAKHYGIAEGGEGDEKGKGGFEMVLEGYGADKRDEIIKRIEVIEKRGRYK